MSREIVDVEGLEKKTPWTKFQIYKFIKDSINPLPYKKVGKKLYFDMERVYKWFDSCPGKDRTP